MLKKTLGEKNTSLLKTAWFIALIIIFSKGIGFIRDIIIAKYYGATMVSDAYFYAYQIPSLALILLGGVGGPFHSAIVSVFTKLIKTETEEPSKYVKNLFNTFVTTTLIIFVILSIIVFMFSDVICSLIISGGTKELIELSSLHLKIMSPIMVIGGIVGIYYGILVTYKKFLIPNISPTFVSLTIIIMLMAISTDKNGIILASATTIGALLQLITQLPMAYKIGYAYKPTLMEIKTKDYKSILELLFPSILSTTVGQIYIYVDMFFTSQLESGAWTAIGYANRIFQFPVGILLTAFLVPLFPLFSKLVAEKKYLEVTNYFNKGTGLLNFAAFPILIGIILLGYDGITILFQRGAFDNQATYMVTQSLIFLSVSILPYIFRDTITRIFFAFNDSKTPFLIALSSILIKIVLNYTLIDKIGIGAITLSTSLVTFVNGFLLAIFIKKKINLDYKLYFKNFFKMFISAIITYFICLFIYRNLPDTNYNNTLFLILKTFLMFILICTIYSYITHIFKLNYLSELINRAFKRKTQ